MKNSQPAKMLKGECMQTHRSSPKPTLFL